MQQELPFTPYKLYRVMDPDTSREAAESVKDLRSRHHTIILAGLEKFGLMTSEEISSRTGLDYWAVARRMSELREAGLVIQTEEKRRNKSGRKAVVWASR